MTLHSVTLSFVSVSSIFAHLLYLLIYANDITPYYCDYVLIFSKTSNRLLILNLTSKTLGTGVRNGLLIPMLRKLKLFSLKTLKTVAVSM